jgi:hypothetical protein
MNEIIGSWEYKSSFDGNKIVLRNNTAKAVFVEFGVGIVGQQNPHENATQAGYEYNLPSEHKYAGNYHDENTWRFYKNSIENVDLQSDYYETWQTRSGDLKIITTGSPATMFVFKAVQEFKALNYAQDIWKQVVKKYWG